MATKDSEYLSRLQDYYAQNHSLPSYARLCEALGLAAKSGCQQVVVASGGARVLVADA